MAQQKVQITEEMAIEAWLEWYEDELRKKAITKRQKAGRSIFMEYLQENPDEGFVVEYEDARGKAQTRRIHLVDTETAKLDRESLKANIVKALLEKNPGKPVTVPTITTAYIAKMVEEGIITAELVKKYEDIMSGQRLKKSKVVIQGEGKGKRPMIVTEKRELLLNPGESATLKLGGPDGPKLIKSDGTEIEPTVIKPEDDEKPLGGKWAVE